MPTLFEEDWINLERPELSRILRAPLPAGAEGSGLGFCRERAVDPARRRVRQLVDGYAHAVKPVEAFPRRAYVAPDRTGTPVAGFASGEDPHYQAMLRILREGRRLALAEPRVDMPGADIIPGESRQLIPIPLPERPPTLKATASAEGVRLSWDHRADLAGLTFELHRGTKPGFVPDDSTRLVSLTRSDYLDTRSPAGEQHYALVSAAKDRRAAPVRAVVTVANAGGSADGKTTTATNPPKPGGLLQRFLSREMAGTEDLVFAARGLNQTDGHWYANFGYYSHDPGRKAYAEGTKLYRLNLRTGALATLLADPTGGVRDPQVSYDGKHILFAYRPGGTENYHLYEMDLARPVAVAARDSVGGSPFAVRRITDGPYDDFEPAYLPDGGIVFVCSRCKRWVNCWLTQVAVLHRCDADGGNLRALSSNNEQDNTPWPLPDGRILYTRWEYVDRSQVDFHHLWTANPDGTRADGLLRQSASRAR